MSTRAIEYFIIDGADPATYRTLIRMTVGADKLDVYFGGQEPVGLKSSDIVTIQGMRVGDTVAAAQATIDGSLLESATETTINTTTTAKMPTVVAAATSTCSTLGVRNTAVLLVTFPGVTPDVTPAQVHDIFFDTAGRSLNSFWQEASYGQTSAQGGVYGWYDLDTTYTCAQTDQIRAAAIAAADADVDFQTIDRLFVAFPNPGGCGWSGAATLGCFERVHRTVPSHRPRPIY